MKVAVNHNVDAPWMLRRVCLCCMFTVVVPLWTNRKCSPERVVAALVSVRVCVRDSAVCGLACGMFVLVEMVDTVRITPWNFQRQLNEAIAEELNKKLANKVFTTQLGCV